MDPCNLIRDAWARDAARRLKLREFESRMSADGISYDEIKSIADEAIALLHEFDDETLWPDGCMNREKWMSHVWYHIPGSVLANACIVAKENDQPFYLPFMEPFGWKPKADFTCWICGLKLPHHHAQSEIDAARKTLEVFRENVWKDLCRPCGEKPWARFMEIFPESERNIWVRFTGMDGIYRWLHPTERRWVEEPDQIKMPLFSDYESARKAADDSPEPPTWQEYVNSRKAAAQ